MHRSPGKGRERGRFKAEPSKIWLTKAGRPFFKAESSIDGLTKADREF